MTSSVLMTSSQAASAGAGGRRDAATMAAQEPYDRAGWREYMYVRACTECGVRWRRRRGSGGSRGDGGWVSGGGLFRTVALLCGERMRRRSRVTAPTCGASRRSSRCAWYSCPTARDLTPVGMTGAARACSANTWATSRTWTTTRARLRRSSARSSLYVRAPRPWRPLRCPAHAALVVRAGADAGQARLNEGLVPTDEEMQEWAYNMIQQRVSYDGTPRAPATGPHVRHGRHVPDAGGR